MESGKSDFGAVLDYGFSCSGYFWREGVWNPREGGKNFHCYNVVPLSDGHECIFDLTSEQFGEEKLCYENNPEQFREVHFTKEEKRLRYEYLRAELLKKLKTM